MWKSHITRLCISKYIVVKNLLIGKGVMMGIIQAIYEVSSREYYVYFFQTFISLFLGAFRVKFGLCYGQVLIMTYFRIYFFVYQVKLIIRSQKKKSETNNLAFVSLREYRVYLFQLFVTSLNQTQCLPPHITML